MLASNHGQIYFKTEPVHSAADEGIFIKSKDVWERKEKKSSTFMVSNRTATTLWAGKNQFLQDNFLMGKPAPHFEFSTQYSYSHAQTPTCLWKYLQNLGKEMESNNLCVVFKHSYLVLLVCNCSL